MGAKKKVEPPPVPQPQPVPDEKTTNNTITFKISEELLVKYSTKMRAMIDESNKKDTLNLSEFDNESVEYLIDFLNLHKEKEPTKISTPIRTNQNLKFIMEEADAEYVDKIMLKGDHFMLKMLQISTALEVEHLRKRLACGVAIKLMKSTLEELKEEYELKEEEGPSEEDLRGEMRAKLETLKSMDEEQP